MIKIANRQIFIFFFDFLKKNMGPSNMGNPVQSHIIFSTIRFLCAQNGVADPSEDKLNKQ